MTLTKRRLKQIIKEELAEAKNLPKKVHAKAAKIRGEKGNEDMSRDQSYAIAANMLKEDEAGPPIMDYPSGSDEEVFETIFNLAQEMGQMATAIRDAQKKTTIFGLVQEILNISQEY